MRNLRQKIVPPADHEDFELHHGSPSVEGYDVRIRSHRTIINKIKSGYYDYAVCVWQDFGKLGEIVEIGSTASGNHFLIKDITGEARKIIESIEWEKEFFVCHGVPQIPKEMFIETYEKYKNRNQT